MIDFSARSNEIEIMDDLDIQGDVIPKTLKELEIINKFLGGNHVTISGISKILDKTRPLTNTLKIADMGCGGGDMLKLISVWAVKNNIDIKLRGIDANQNIIDYARENTRGFHNIEFTTGNVFNLDEDPNEYDIIICTLFLHHFSQEESIHLLSNWYNKSRLGVVVNDLHRHPVAYHSIKFLTRVLSKSYMVKNDAPLSVLRAFSKKDLKLILEKSGIANYQLKWEWAFRWKLVIIKE